MRRLPVFLALLYAASWLIPLAAAADKKYTDTERNHWSFRKRTLPMIPQISEAADRAWVRNPIDAFVLTKLRQAGLRPAPEADRRTLVRRLYFDLTGLPPSPAAVAAFVADPSPAAYEKLVDALLASPHYGERWAQHWLDVVRFAETEGFEYDRHRPDAWKYRDYVIRAFNTDKPYDRFIAEQVAGDERKDDEDHEAQVAAGFHRLGAIRRNAGNPEVAFSRNEVLTEMNDMIGAAFLGLTVGCARCHDHKFDAIRQKDYYRLQAFLAATQEHDLPLAPPEAVTAWQARHKKMTREIERLRKALTTASDEARPRLEEQLKAAEDQLPPPLQGIFTVKNEEDKRTPIHLLKRGDEDKKEEPVGMRVLGVLLPEGAPELPPDTGDPKTLLAGWLTDPGHPLVARVMVNRLWLWHFGQGIVSTPNDFGANGSPPSHPALLDYLAETLVRGGWHVKPLHRLILLSSTYRQASRPADAQLSRAKDPENRLLSHFSRRRLSAEEVRDSLLVIAGKFNPKAGGPSIMVPVEPELVNLLYKPSQWEVARDKTEHDRRSVYLIAKRNLRLPFLEVFNQPDLQTSCGRREASTHAPQALEFLNGKLSNLLAEAFAERLRRDAGEDPERQVRLAFRLVAGRDPTSKEKHLSLEFLAGQPLREFALAMFSLNDFLYVD
jgi:hypothetical protein